MIGTNLVLSWIPLFAGWIAVSIARGSAQPIGLWFLLTLAVGAAVILITGAALLLIAITSPAGLLGALIVAAPITYIDVVFPKSMLWLNNLTGQTLFVSPTIGFGLDNPLLLWQRLSYLMGGVFFLLLAVLCVQLRERLGVARWYHLLCTLFLLILIGGTTLSSIMTFQQIGASYTDVGALTARPAQATTSQFAVTVQADPGTGNVQGTTSFLLTPKTTLSDAFIIGLNPGLHVQHVTTQTSAGNNTQALTFSEVSPGWTSIHIANTALAAGRALKLVIVYGGTMLFSRDDYALASGGFGFQHAVNTLAGIIVPATLCLANWLYALQLQQNHSKSLLISYLLSGWSEQNLSPQPAAWLVGKIVLCAVAVSVFLAQMWILQRITLQQKTAE